MTFYANMNKEKEKIKYLKFWKLTPGTQEAEDAWKAKCEMDERIGNRSEVAPMVIGDIAPYRSMVDGKMIEGRAQHKQHLARHNLIEIGNETQHLKPKDKTPDPRLKETIARAVYDKLRY